MQNPETTYCKNGCPFGTGAVAVNGGVCPLRADACPINKMYLSLALVHAGEQHCAYCSMHRSDPKGSYPANTCGQCFRFCPACDAPRG